MRRVVITGMGTINPVGHDLEETWTGIQNGVCGIDFIKQIDTSQYKVKIAAEVKDYEADKYLDRKEARRMDRYTQFAMIAFREGVRYINEHYSVVLEYEDQICGFSERNQQCLREKCPFYARKKGREDVVLINSERL